MSARRHKPRLPLNHRLLQPLRRCRAKAAVTPARRTSFKEVTSQLDPGGSVFVYLATDQWLAGLSTNVARLRDVIQNLPNVPRPSQEQLNLVFKLLIDAIPRTGIEGVSGLGVSGVQITQELHRSKLVVHHNAGQGQGLLWNLFGGQAHRLRALDMLPRTTALAVFGDLDIMQVWKFVERTVSDSGDSGLANGLREWQRGLEQGASLSWTNLLASFGGEAGIILTLDDSRRLTLPVGPRPIDLPEPGLIIALKINDDTLYDRISQQLKANPQTEVKEEAGLKMCVMPLGLPLPMPVQLSVASSGDYFFAATAPELIRAVLDARSGKAPGLAQSPRFKALRQYLPAEGNQFFFVNKRFSESLRAIQKQAMESNPSAGGQAAFLEALLFSKPAAFGLAVGGHTPAGWEVVSVGNRDSSGTLLLGPAIGGIAVPAAMLLPALAKAKSRAQSLNCANNLKMIGVACRTWALDNGDQFPFNVSTNKGGTLEFCARGDSGFDLNSYRHFQVMSSELSVPHDLVLPRGHFPKTRRQLLEPARRQCDLPAPVRNERQRRTPAGGSRSLPDPRPRASLRWQCPARPPLVVMNINPLTYSAVLFRAGGVARTLQITADMLGARALPARKTPRRLRHRIYAHDHLVGRAAEFAGTSRQRAVLGRCPAPARTVRFGLEYSRGGA